MACELDVKAHVIVESYVLNALNRFKRSATAFDVGRLFAAKDSERHAPSIRYQTLPSRRSTNWQLRMLYEGGFTEGMWLVQ